MTDTDYSPRDDFARSYEECLREVRERKAAGGSGWQPKEHFLNGKVTLHCGDCLQVLAQLPECSIDSCVTDPPYHLTSIVKRFGGENAAPAQHGTDGAYKRASAGFMGQVWDGGDVAFRPETWAEVYRVLKPGGYLLAFSGTRTYHRMACAIEDAGFEVRDMVSWVYGSGFPKSHDVSKGIDKTNGEVGRAHKFTAWMRSTGLKSAQIDRITCTNMGGHYTTAASQPAVPTRDLFEKLRPYIPVDIPEWVETLIERVEAEREVVSERRVQRTSASWETTSGMLAVGEQNFDITAPATDAAREWAGWGTALKPALEPICMARKPLSEGTVAANVLRWGTGAINVDGCRVATEENLNGGAYSDGDKSAEDASSYYTGTKAGEYKQPTGRWPANVIHDGSEEVTAAFPSETVAGGAVRRQSAHESQSRGDFAGMEKDFPFYGDSGSAARFFYQVKQDDTCHLINSASDVVEHFGLQSEHVVSALSHAVGQSTQRLAVQSTSYRAQNTNVSGQQLKLICASVIETIQNLERRFSLALPPENITVRLGPAMCVATPSQIGITTITINLSTSDQCAAHVTFNIIETNAEVGAKGYASRLFYSAKADADDRLGSKHPTVKPVDLMQYLVRLVTPKGGTVLDPFAGTGTTGEAAFREGMQAILIEREAEYQADIRRRMALVMAGPDERARESMKEKLKDKPRDDGPLFSGIMQEEAVK